MTLETPTGMATASQLSEGIHYVRFTDLTITEGDEVWIRVRPGNVVTDPSGRSFADAYISGLQLVQQPTSQ